MFVTTGDVSPGVEVWQAWLACVFGASGTARPEGQVFPAGIPFRLKFRGLLLN